MESRFLNQRGLIDGDRLSKTRFVVIGAGAIGSAFCLGLGKMGARIITLYDFDTLEDHNFANQLHPISQLGKAKVDSLVAVAKDYGDCIITPINAPWTPGNAVDADVVISCVDNMDVRAALWRHYSTRGVFFIDGRMSAFVFKVFGIDATFVQEGLEQHIRVGSDAMHHYASTLHSQASASPEPCGEKSIIYTVFLVAGMMLSQVREFLTEEAKPYRATETVYDALNHTIRRIVLEEQPKMVVIEAEEEVHDAGKQDQAVA